MERLRFQFTLSRLAIGCVCVAVFFAIGSARLSPDPVTTVIGLAALVASFSAAIASLAAKTLKGAVLAIVGATVALDACFVFVVLRRWGL
jgi:hypothetical protein